MQVRSESRPADPADTADPRGARRRRRRAASVLPTLLTLGNAICGFAAIHYAAKPVEDNALGYSTLSIAGSLVFLGMFFDAIDGSVARLTRSTSDMGAQLDSLADVITFGVAPAFMTLRLISEYYGPNEGLQLLGPADGAYAKLLWAVAAFYMCCTALRLARFNAEVRSAKEEDHLFFKGLPSPGAGGTVASLIVLHQHLLHEHSGIEDRLAFARASALGIPIVMGIVAFAMISNLRYSHFANKVLRARRGFRALLRIVIPVLIAIWWPVPALAGGFVVYALSGPVMSIFERRKQLPATPPRG